MTDFGSVTYFDGYGYVDRAPGAGLLRIVATSDVLRAWNAQQLVFELSMSTVTAVQVTDGTTYTKRVPPWAVVVGIIGLLVFFLGALFFFVKETVPKPGTVVSLMTIDGGVVHVQTPQPFGIGQASWWPLVTRFGTR